MDSISQLALGAALGELTLGRHIGRRALVLGAILGTLPDLDVLVRYSDAVEGFTRHRSWSHSLLVLALVSLPMAWLLRRYVKPGADRARDRAASIWRWYAGVALILTTHPILDAFTTYGTQLFWPLPVPPVVIGSIFIIDPIYTVPLLVGIVWAWRRRTRVARRACQIGLLLSSLYLGLSLLSQAHARQIGEQALASKGLSSDTLLVAPFPFAVLWRFISTNGEQYHEGWYSLLDRSGQDITFTAHDRNLAILEPVQEHWPVHRLDWFTGGLYSASWQDEDLLMTDLRIGAESGYIFSFVVATKDDGDTTPIISQAVPPQVDLDGLRSLMGRYLNASGPSEVGDSPDQETISR